MVPKTALSSVYWKLDIPILNQGNKGKCVAESGTEICGGADKDGDGPTSVTVTAAAATQTDSKIGYSAFDTRKDTEYKLDDEFSDRLYEVCTRTDSVQGAYPPDDTGSTGLGLAKALVSLGLAQSSYSHAFSFLAVQTALQNGPVTFGIPWYNSMFDTDPDGHVHVDLSSGLAGGHELVAFAMEMDTARLWFPNHWGSWGGKPPAACGDFTTGWGYFTFTEFERLLADQGDATIIIPVRANRPTPPQPVPPQPGSDADQALWNEVGSWAHNPKKLTEATAAGHVLDWGKAKGYA